MDYRKLVDVYRSLENTTKRLEKTSIIAEFLKITPSKDLPTAMLLIQGKVFPEWDERNSGMAARLVLKAISKATGADASQVEKKWAQVGDLGLVAEQLTSKKSQAALFSQKLTITKVFDNIRKAASIEGAGTVDRKVGLVAELLTSADPQEARYIIRTVLEELRVGTASGTLRDAIIWAYFTDSGVEYNPENKSLDVADREKYNEVSARVQEAYDLCTDFGTVAQKAKEHKLDDVSLQVGTPIKVMLGPKEPSAKEALERVGIPAQAEFKYDGFRLQIHKSGKGVTLFTRNLEKVTDQFPEVVEYVQQHVDGVDFILDAEAVGFNPKTGAYMPFQHVSQRIKRKYDIDKIAKELPVELNIFDCIYHNGRSMLREQFSARRKLLEKIVHPVRSKIRLAEAAIVNSEKELIAFYKKSLAAGNEGAMVKKLDAPYKPGARVGHMVKMKETEEPLDLVITEAEWGEGKRAQWLSSFTLACQDEDGNLVEIGKVGTGIKEKEEEEGVTFDQLTDLLKPLITSQKGKVVKVKPKIVVEVAYEELQKSPTYSSGYALRFPRVLRLRDMERSVDDIATLEYIEEYFYKQKK